MRAHTTTPPHGKTGLIVDNTYPRTHTFFPPRQFDNIYKLEAVPVATVQLRFNGWVTELQVRPSVRLSVVSVATLYGKTQGGRRMRARVCNQGLESPIFNPPHPNLPPHA